MRLTIYIENQKLDLFKDEVIELNSSVANTDDVTKINTDYTKTFTVPASENNNNIFKHYYQADIDNTFDSRTKKDGYIKFDGFLFKTGKFRLEKVNVKNNKPSAYTINFWGKLVNIKTLLKNDTLNDLPLSQYDHDFSYNNFFAGLDSTVPGTGGNVIYNLFETKKQYTYNPLTNENTATLVNVAFNGNQRGIIFWDKRPSIRLLALIQAIEVKYGIVFSRQFFNRVDFTELFMWCYKDSTQKSTGFVRNNFIIFPTIGLNASYAINCIDTNGPVLPGGIFQQKFNVICTVAPEPGFELVPYTLTTYLRDDDAGTLATIESVLNLVGTGAFNKIYETTVIGQTRNLTNFFLVSTTEPFRFTVGLQMIERRYDDGTMYFENANNYITPVIISSAIFKMADNLPRIKITDFLKGLFQMFKLVAIPLEDGTIYINNVDDFYKEGTLYDLTKYIDFKDYDVQRGTINNVINFKYQDPTTLLNLEFKKNTGIAYGDEFLELADEDGIPLDGEPLEVTLPFEQPIYERLTGTAIQYALIVNEKLEKANPKPIIFYNNRTPLGSTNISLFNGTTFVSAPITSINNPSATLGLDAPATSLSWGVEFSTWNFQAVNQTLFSMYWQSYILSVFNIKKREFKFKAVLPSHILLKLKLNDIIYIKERYYRINDFTINLNSRETTLNLNNTFDSNFGLFLPSQTEIKVQPQADFIQVYVSNSSIMNITLQALSSGTAWLTAVKNNEFIDINISANTTGIARELFINVNNGAGQSFQIYVNQL